MMIRKTRPAIAIAIVSVVIALVLGACSPQPSSKSDSPDESREAVNSVGGWSMQSDCSTCHEKQQASLDDSACLAGSHFSAGRATCISCHTDEAGLSSVHEGVTEAKTVRALKATEVSDDACLVCHGSYDELAKRTEDYVGTTDKNGTTVNPHNLPKTEGHSALSCTYCHEGHKEVSDLSKKCVTCHHAEVYECGTCHE